MFLKYYATWGKNNMLNIYSETKKIINSFREEKCKPNSLLSNEKLVSKWLAKLFE